MKSLGGPRAATAENCVTETVVGLAILPVGGFVPKPRPALIVSIDPINDLRPGVLVIPITTRTAPLRVAMPDEPAITGLRELSYAKCESVGPVHKSHLKARLGRLPANGWPVVEAGLARVFGLRIAG